MKNPCIKTLILVFVIALFGGCSKSFHGTFEPMVPSESITSTSIISRPFLRFTDKYVQVSHQGTSVISEYEYRVLGNMLEVIIADSGKREIWKIEIQEDGSLRDGDSIWRKK